MEGEANLMGYACVVLFLVCVAVYLFSSNSKGE
jgi:hypothetical protein